MTHCKHIDECDVKIRLKDFRKYCLNDESCLSLFTWGSKTPKEWFRSFK